jgi:hypothetical protein
VAYGVPTTDADHRLTRKEKPPRHHRADGAFRQPSARVNLDEANRAGLHRVLHVHRRRLPNLTPWRHRLPPLTRISPALTLLAMSTAAFK